MGEMLRYYARDGKGRRTEVTRVTFMMLGDDLKDGRGWRRDVMETTAKDIDKLIKLNNSERREA